MTPTPRTIGHMLRVVLALGWTDFQLKYRGSVLGYFWSFAAPLVQFVVILAVFQPMIGDSIPHYPLHLFLGLILWEFFSLTTSACAAVPLQKIHLMQKISLPRSVFIYSVGWTHLVIFLTRFLIYLAFALAYGSLSVNGLLLVPVLLLHMLLLSLGIGMLLAAFSLQYRDIPHLWSVTSQILFWLTPIVYDIARSGPLSQELVRYAQDSVSLFGLLQAVATFQPVSILIVDARRMLLPGYSVPSTEHLVLFTLFCLVVFIAGKFAFQYRSRYFLQQY